MITFGPVPSRRLGRSLGINNIPPKACTYSCVYCQLGRTINMEAKERSFYALEDIRKDVTEKIDLAHKAGESLDYCTFVPDGEPTLDIHLGKEIELIKSLGVKVAVITNSSLIWQKRVQDDLQKADWSAVDQLIDMGLMVKKIFQGKTFYSRRLFAPRNKEKLVSRME
jgi:wyosine [tRNA(Phe)-imidazoG37] synthetase (radical SAM superfamily)